MMQLPLTLPLANHLPRRMALIRRPDRDRDSQGRSVRVLEIEILSDAEESCLITRLSDLAALP